MFTLSIVLLCLLVILSAVWADRSARASHRWRAVGLNLCAIGCLVLGWLAIYAWSCSRLDRTRQIAVADPPGKPATAVRLLVHQHAPQADVKSNRSGPAEDEPATMVPVSVNVDATRPATVRQLSEAESLPHDAAPLPAEAVESDRIELEESEAGEDDGREPETTEPDEGLALELRSRVEIDFDARPDWVERPDLDVGNVHQISVNSGPYRTRPKARQELYKLLKPVTDDYINELVGSPRAARWVSYDEERIRQMLLNPRNIFDEKVISPSVGLMYQSHALLEYGPAFHADVERAWHQVVARAQLVKVALVGGGMLGILVLLFGYFNADTATRGFYSGRLKFLTAAAILGMIATGIFLARSIPWLWL